MKTLNNPMSECEQYQFADGLKFSDADIWAYVKEHMRIKDMLNPRKVSAVTQFVFAILEGGVDMSEYDGKKWKFRFNKNWKVPRLLNKGS